MVYLKSLHYLVLVFATIEYTYNVLLLEDQRCETKSVPVIHGYQ